jgi:hypothetical protein
MNPCVHTPGVTSVPVGFLPGPGKDRRGREALEREKSRASGRLVEVAEVAVPARVATVPDGIRC